MTDALRFPSASIEIMEPTGLKARHIAEHGIMRVLGWDLNSNAEWALNRWNSACADPLMKITKDSVLLGIDQVLGKNGEPASHSALAMAHRHAKTQSESPVSRTHDFIHESMMPLETGEDDMALPMQFEVYSKSANMSAAHMAFLAKKPTIAAASTVVIEVAVEDDEPSQPQQLAIVAPRNVSWKRAVTQVSRWVRDPTQADDGAQGRYQVQASEPTSSSTTADAQPSVTAQAATEDAQPMEEDVAAQVEEVSSSEEALCKGFDVSAQGMVVKDDHQALPAGHFAANDEIFESDPFPELELRSASKFGRRYKKRGAKPGTRPDDRPVDKTVIATYEQACQIDTWGETTLGQRRPNPKVGDYMKFVRGQCVAYLNSPGQVQAGAEPGRTVFRHVRHGTVFGPIAEVEHTVSFTTCKVPVIDPITRKKEWIRFNMWHDFNTMVHQQELKVAGCAFYEITSKDKKPSARADPKAAEKQRSKDALKHFAATVSPPKATTKVKVSVKPQFPPPPPGPPPAKAGSSHLDRSPFVVGKAPAEAGTAQASAPQQLQPAELPPQPQQEQPPQQQQHHQQSVQQEATMEVSGEQLSSSAGVGSEGLGRSPSVDTSAPSPVDGGGTQTAIPAAVAAKPQFTEGVPVQLNEVNDLVQMLEQKPTVMSDDFEERLGHHWSTHPPAQRH